jgi:glucokinase
MMSYYLGIEIGGTKLQLGVGAGDGKLTGLWRGEVDVKEGPEGIRRQIVGAVPELLARAGLGQASLQGVGIGFGGPVDDATQTVIESHQIDGWDGFPLADWVSDLVGPPAVLGNDADVAGLAEALYGAGKGLSPIFYVTIGSGIGGGLIIDGEIYRGCGRGAAEIGHLLMGEMVGSFPVYRTLESIASGWGMQEWARRLLSYRPHSVLNRRTESGHDITASDIAQAAELQDETAQEILDRAIDALSAAFCHVITLLCPRRIVIGGGVSLMGEDLLFVPLRRLVAERVFGAFAGLTDIVPAALGEEVVVHGAVSLARKRLGEKS